MDAPSQNSGWFDGLIGFLMGAAGVGAYFAKLRGTISRRNGGKEVLTAELRQAIREEVAAALRDAEVRKISEQLRLKEIIERERWHDAG